MADSCYLYLCQTIVTALKVSVELVLIHPASYRELEISTPFSSDSRSIPKHYKVHVH